MPINTEVFWAVRVKNKIWDFVRMWKIIR